MINGGHEGAMKHLTVEMQKSLKGDGKSNAASQLSAFDQIKAASSDFQVFETGPVLLSATNPKAMRNLKSTSIATILAATRTIWTFHFTSSAMA